MALQPSREQLIRSMDSFRSATSTLHREFMQHKDEWTGEIEGQESYLIHPQSFFRRNWDLLTMVVVLYIFVFIPFRLAYNTDHIAALDYIDWVVDCIFWVDMVFNFFTGYTEDAVVVMDHTKIFKKYMQRWFWIDAVSSIPFDKIPRSLFALDAQYAQALKLMKLIRLLRVFRIARILGRLKLWSQIRFSVRAIIKFFFVLLVLAHWNACVFFFIAVNESKHQLTWVRSLEETPGELEDALPGTQYVVSFYWAITTMTTVGFGDIVPTTNIERMYVVFAMLAGCSTFAYGITQIVTLVSNLNASEVRYQSQMDELSEYMEARSLPEDLRHRLREFYEFKKTHGGEFLREGEILNNLPQSLRSAVLLSMNKTVAEKLRQFPLFEGLEEDIITRVMAKLRFKSYPPGEIVLIEGEIGHSMYFINRGSLQVKIDGNVVAKIGEGRFFGEVALYSKFGRRIATVATLTYCECFALVRTDLEELLAPVPQIMERIRERSEALFKLFEESPAYLAFCKRMNLSNGKEQVDQSKEIEFAANEEVSQMALQRLRDLDRRFQRLVKRLEPLIDVLSEATPVGQQASADDGNADDDNY